jgi:MFS family permease
MTLDGPPDTGQVTVRAGLLTAAGLALAVAVTNGFARFAYALILPAMRSDLGWNYTEAGWNNTANAIGYLAGAVVVFRVARRRRRGRRVGPRRLFAANLWVTAAASPEDQGASKPFDFITANEVRDEINDDKAFAACI